jgi:hypothetical protein
MRACNIRSRPMSRGSSLGWWGWRGSSQPSRLREREGNRCANWECVRDMFRAQLNSQIETFLCLQESQDSSSAQSSAARQQDRGLPGNTEQVSCLVQPPSISKTGLEMPSSARLLVDGRPQNFQRPPNAPKNTPNVSKQPFVSCLNTQHFAELPLPLPV